MCNRLDVIEALDLMAFFFLACKRGVVAAMNVSAFLKPLHVFLHDSNEFAEISARQYALPDSDNDSRPFPIQVFSEVFIMDTSVEFGSADVIRRLMTIFQEMNMADNNQGNKNGGTGNRGFASMDDDKQRAIASQGGRAAHASGNAHEFSSDEAREAGRKGGQNSHGGSAQNSNSGSSDSKSGSSDAKSGGTRGGSSEQHAKAGSQSHKNK